MENKKTVEEMISLYERDNSKKMKVIVLLFCIIIVSAFFSVSVGSAKVGAKDIINMILNNINSLKFPVEDMEFKETVLLQVRLPRVLMGIIIGASLAATGALMQGVLRNPLVSPYTLGISSGSAFGAGLAMVLGISVFGTGFTRFSKYAVVINAFIFGLLTTFIVYAMAKLKTMSASTLILAGVAISYLFSALVSILKFVSDKDKLHDLTFWIMGGLWTADWGKIAVLFVINLICFILMMKLAGELNAFAFGDEVALSLGIDTDKVRKRCLIISALATSSCIAFAGTIGFIGLVAPHISRHIVGNDYKYLVPCSSLMGAVILLVSDTLARIVIQPTELPVGIVTSLLGVPFFVYILMKKGRG